MYDVVTAPVSYEAHVLTGSRENADDFPFEPVTLLRVARWRWLVAQIQGRLWPPANPWKHPLRRLGDTPALIHAHFGPIGWRVVDAGLSPVVTSFYGFDASKASSLKRWRSAYRLLFSAGTAFVAEGPAMRERLVGLGAPPEKTHVVPLIAHLDEDWCPASREDGEPARVLMAGRLVEKKGFVDGIAAFAEARRNGVEARLSIVGVGPEEERLRAAARSHGVADVVEFLPSQPRERFRELVRSCHVLLQPSRTASDGDAEGGAPTTLLEAQALGRVVVATDHADIPHVVDREVAFLSPEGESDALSASLTRALTASDEWTERGAAGRRFVEEHHSREHVASRLEALYDRVSASAGKARA
jgi:colanic acid/amylovoran biosynthesis glycosyltransferase